MHTAPASRDSTWRYMIKKT